MKNKKDKVTKRIFINLTDDEFSQLTKKFQARINELNNPYLSLSKYIRGILFNKEV